jgi:electron transfer flavoprotein beta subunit
MNIIVCIKQVPDISEIDVKIDPKTHTLIREKMPSVINPFDMYALEESIRLKEKFGGKITVLSMGPPQAKDILREALSLGADEAILISDTKFRGADTLATSFTIAEAIKKLKKYTLILCGKQAADGDTAQVPPEIAEFLEIPVITFVRKIVQINDKYAKIERLLEHGIEVVETELPALFTVVKEINEPRLPSLKGKLKAKQMKIPVWGNKVLKLDTNKIGLGGSPTQVIHTFTPKQKREGRIFNGVTLSAIKCVVELLKEVR